MRGALGKSECRVERRRRSAAGVLAVLLAVTLGCSETSPKQPASRAVVFAIDGADWKIVDALAEQDRLPHLQALRARGVSGPVRTVADLPISPVIWTTVATGKTAAQHGISWFLVDQPDGSRTPVRSDNRAARAIWNILAERDRIPVVVGWWATYPAEDVGEGVIVSDALGFHGFGRTARSDLAAGKTHPADLFPEMDAVFPSEQQISAAFARRFFHIDAEQYGREKFDPSRDPRRDPESPIQLFQQYAATAQGYTAMAERLLETHPYDLFMVYFEQVDSFSHLFMKYAPPRLPGIDPAGFERYRDAVSEWYVYQDELLGRLLDRIDLETTAVFVLSDHGFKSGDRRIQGEETVDVRKAHLDHEPEGILIAAGPGIRRGGTIAGASVTDLTPTLLHYLDLAVGRDMAGRVLEELFEPSLRDHRPIRYVASYEPGGTARGDEPTQAAEESLGSHDRMAALRTLGYVRDGEAGEAPGSSPEIHNNLGRVQLLAGRLAAARAEFEKSLVLDPDNPDALLGLGAVASARGDGEQAQQLAHRALRMNPNSVSALAQLADLKRDEGDLAGAVRLYSDALAIDDSRPGLFLSLGDVLQRAGRLQEAEEAFRHVLALEPDSVAARYNLGVTAMRGGDLDGAMAHYEEALAVSADHPLAAAILNNMGSIQLARGDRQAALARFEEAAALSPSHFESHFNAGTQHLALQRQAEAVPHLEAAARLAPEHEGVNVALGIAYLRLGRNADAYRTLLLVRRLHPENWMAPLGLAAIAEDEDRARALLQEAIELGGESARAEARQHAHLGGLLPDAP